MNSRSLAYAGLAVATAFLVGFFLSPYGIIQTLLITVIAAALAVWSIARAEESLEEPESRLVNRSRVVHYARVSKVADGRRLVGTATNAFEAALLRTRGWQKMPSPQLRYLAEQTPEQERAA